MKNPLDMEINESQLSDLVLYKHKWLTSSSLLILYKYIKKWWFRGMAKKRMIKLYIYIYNNHR